MTVRRFLCLSCREVSRVDDDDPAPTGCPACDDHGIPADADDTVTITLTTHELRILTMWADNYARVIAADRERPDLATMPAVVRGIIDHVGTQTAAPLTLSQELADVRAAFPDATVTLHRGGAPTDE